MQPWLAHRIAVVRAIISTPWRIILGIFGVIAAYDTVVSQFVPEELARHAPKVWQVGVLTGGLLPWWIWLLILAGILVLASFEYAFRRTAPSHQSPEQAAGQSSYISDQTTLSAVEPIFDGFEDQSVWMSAHDLVTHIVDRSVWALGMGMDRETLLTHPGGYLVREIQRVGQNGDLASLGRENGKGLHQEIPASFWFSSTIDIASIYGPDATKMGRTRPAGSERTAEIIVEDVPFYSDLRFKRADVYKAWPPTSRTK